MINSISSLPMVQGVNVQSADNKNTKVQQNLPSNIPNGVTMNGAEALASYNVPIVSKTGQKPLTPSPITVLQPAAIHSMEGERIYSSTGALKEIIKRNDKTTTVYIMDKSAPNDAISKIRTYDNVTGKIIRSQFNDNQIEEGKIPVLKFVGVTNYTPDGKVAGGTGYKEGKLVTVWQEEHKPDGTTTAYTYDYETKESFVTEHDDKINASRRIYFDKDGKIKSMETRDYKNFTEQNVYYKNGILAENRLTQNIPIENHTGRDPLHDEELTPSQPYVLGYDPKEVQGEKSYYSNGILEFITTNTKDGKVTHNFDITGNLEAIEFPDGKVITYDVNEDLDPYYSIEEKLSNGDAKITRFGHDGSKSVTVVSADKQSEKHASYTKEGKMDVYYETNHDEDSLFMRFDSNGNLIKCS